MTMRPEQAERARQRRQDWSQRHRDALRAEGLNAHGETYVLPADDPRRRTKKGQVDVNG